MKRIFGALVVAGCVAHSCGYPEAEMQAQRDQITQLRAAVTSLSEATATNEQTIAALTAENDRLVARLKECTTTSTPPKDTHNE